MLAPDPRHHRRFQAGLPLIGLSEFGQPSLFDADAVTVQAAQVVNVTRLHAKIGEFTLENDFLSGALGKAGLLSARR